MSCRQEFRLLVCKVFVLRRVNWTKQESVWRSPLRLLGNSCVGGRG